MQHQESGQVDVVSFQKQLCYVDFVSLLDNFKSFIADSDEASLKFGGFVAGWSAEEQQNKGGYCDIMWGVAVICSRGKMQFAPPGG